MRNTSKMDITLTCYKTMTHLLTNATMLNIQMMAI